MEVSRKVMRRAVEWLEAGRTFALATVVGSRGSVPGKPGAKMLVPAVGPAFGTVGGAGLETKTEELARRCLRDRKGGSFRFDLAYHRPGGLDSLCGGSVEVVIEVMAAPPHILIGGGGHVGLEVARLCDQLEYLYSVLDDRADFASRERFPGARDVFAVRPEDFFPGADLSSYSHVVLAGYSHHLDTAALEHCVRRFRGRILVLASRSKRGEMWTRMAERGIGAAEMARVEAPAGVAIGAESPAEIAVSLLAAVIRDHREGARAEAT